MVTLNTVHPALCMAAVDSVVPATAMDIVVACVGVGVWCVVGPNESTASEEAVAPSVPVEVV
jgi:hypothetical protein